MNNVSRGITRSIFLFCIVVMLSGCLERLYHPKIDVIEGRFVTPKGQFEVDTFNRTDIEKLPFNYEFHTKKKTSNIYLHSNDGETYISIGFLPQYKNLGVIHNKKNPFKFMINDMSYYINAENSNINYELSKRKNLVKNKYGEYKNKNTIFLNLPESLAALDTTIQGGGLKASTVNKIRVGEKDVHRFVISFSLDEDEYLIDVSFHVKLRTSWTLRVPGGGF